VWPAFPASGFLLQPIHEHDWWYAALNLPLLRIGIDRLVAMRWRMGDSAAWCYDRTLYKDRLAVSRFLPGGMCQCSVHCSVGPVTASIFSEARSGSGAACTPRRPIGPTPCPPRAGAARAAWL
jgi:hypothetical protein